MSKVLKTVAKEDLEAFMKTNDILPTLQHGFRKGRSCTTALATAQAAWVSAKAKAKVVAVVGFDLSAAFDTVGREDLLPKMSAMGIGGKALSWYRCYMTNAKKRVVWDGQVSDVIDVEYRVRQGSTSPTSPSGWRSGRPTATAATPTTRLSGSWQRMSRRRSRNCNGW
jgi:hypothetical protein